MQLDTSNECAKRQKSAKFYVSSNSLIVYYNLTVWHSWQYRFQGRPFYRPLKISQRG